MKSSKILLCTGGLGYIGSHTVCEAIEHGYEVVIIDDLSNSTVDILDTIEKITGTRPKLHIGNISDKELLNEIFSQSDVDAVLHFAGLKAVWESCEKPLEYLQNNVGGTMTLLDAMMENGVSKIIFSSSATVLRLDVPMPLNEEGELKTTNPYSTSKLIIEQMIIDMCRYTDLRWILLRYFNPIGAHSSGLLGEIPSGIPNNLFPYICDVISGKREKLNVFGNDYETADGTCIRDYIDIRDLAEAHVKSLDYFDELGEGHEVFNLGTGKGTSVLEFVEKVSAINNDPLPHEICDRRPGDMDAFWCDSSKAHKKLKWKTKYTIDDAIKAGIDFTFNRK